jgi:rhodanese-related sulfurtransferase
MFSIFKRKAAPAIDFKALLQEGAVVLDVRTPAEFHDGHYAGAVNIPLDKLAAGLQEIKTENKTIITVCRSGARSVAAAGMLQKAGVKAFNGGGWTSFARQVQS